MNDPSMAKYILKVLFTIGIITALYSCAFILRQLINKKGKEIFQRHYQRKLVYYITTVICLIFVIFYWIKNVVALGAIAGVFGAAIAIALAKPITKIFGWIVIITRKIYTVGDRIQIGDLKGDVIDVRLLYTVLLEVGNWVESEQSTGRVVYLPNDEIFSNNVFNYTYGFKYIWNEIPIIITFESNHKKAADILNEILNSPELKVHKPAREGIDKMSEKYVIQFKTLTPFVWVKIVDSGVQLSMRYLTDVWKRRTTEHFIAEKILDKFNNEPDIELAYPTYRILRQEDIKKDTNI
jgi:small-conductance mechanosensitive channel